MTSRASYSRVFYEPYDIDTGEAVGDPTDYKSACIVAQASLQDCSVRWHHSEPLTDRVRKTTVLVRDFFDDEISRAIRTTEIVGAAVRPDLHNEIAEEGYDRCIDCGTHVTTVREAARES